MLPHRALGALVVLALVLALPAAAAQKVSVGTPDFAAPPPPPAGTQRVTFYGYVFASTLTTPMPANTQYPSGVADWGSGLVDAPINCGLPGQETCDGYEINKIALYNTAGPVQMKSTAEFNYEDLHNEHGLTQNILFDTTQDVTASIHVSAAAHAWPHNENATPCIARDPPQNVPCAQAYWRWHSGVNPQFQIRAWLYAMVLGDHGADARDTPPVEAKWDAGEGTLVAVGESTPVNLASLDGNGGNERVWRFDVNLGKPQVPEVPREANLVLVYSFHNMLPDGSEVGFSTPIRVNTGEFFPTTFTIPVKNAFTVELVSPQVVHEKLVVVGVMNTPWGSYDVDPASVKLVVTDASGGVVDSAGLKQYADYSVAHGGHYKPINMTFVWDYLAAKLAPGAYRVTLSASNYQGSAGGSLSGFFEVGKDGRIVRTEAGRAAVTTFTDEQFRQFVAGAGGTAPASNGTRDAGPPLPGALAPAVGKAAREREPFEAPALAPLAAVAAALVAARLRRGVAK